MIARVFQHVPFEDIGSIRGWLENHGYEIRYTRFFQNELPPETPDYDLLIVMGGPMSVLDQMEYPWLCKEKEAVQQALALEKPMVGICLGAQMMAYALNAVIRKNPVKEIGWFAVESVVLQMPVFQFPESLKVFHWHGETFDIPEGAIRLCQSAHCVNQAFQFGRRAVGLQFHLETTPDSAYSIVTECGDELVSGVPTIQNSHEILEAPTSFYEAVTPRLYELLDYLTAP